MKKMLSFVLSLSLLSAGVSAENINWPIVIAENGKGDYYLSNGCSISQKQNMDIMLKSVMRIFLSGTQDYLLYVLKK